MLALNVVREALLDRGRHSSLCSPVCVHASPGASLRCVGTASGMHIGSSSVIVSVAVLLLQNGLGALAFVAQASTTLPRTWNNQHQLSLDDPKTLLFSMSTSPSSGQQNAEVIVVGSCNADLVTYTPRLPRRGESSMKNTSVYDVWFMSEGHKFVQY